MLSLRSVLFYHTQKLLSITGHLQKAQVYDKMILHRLSPKRRTKMLTNYESAADKKEYILFYKHVTGVVTKAREIPHFHNSIEIVFMTRGTCLMTVGKSEHLLTEGEAAFVNSLELHKYIPYDGSEYYVILVSSDFFDMKNKLSEISFPSFMDKCKGFYRIKEFLDFSIQGWEDVNTLLKQGFVNMLLGLMMQTYPVKKKETSHEGELIVRALEYVSLHFREDISIAEIAGELGYSQNYFSTLFNSYLGTSFRDYLNRCRVIEYLRLREADPGLPVLRAAEASGFKSPNTFYRAYEKYKGVKS